ncbi:MAG: bifunctional UDP-N-acetylglucosamine diphosphorylase/glucosamine-1-phosphate N-acetyltransferase GlmU [Thermoanaerobaculia bacterium]|nr:bifunctional UDP-N-acetylglucosamine diphosphorylase/glucosamine-1-phosphate N-acetyltransferase GlmU [Thermoanaerobaculia bacterium]
MNRNADSPKQRQPRVAVVLAAGKGTRLRSERPKVLHEAGGKPLLAWVIAAARAAACERILVVVGHGAAAVRDAFATESDLVWVEQHEQRGTGHALLQAEPHLAGEPALLLVLSGDVPLLRPGTLGELAAAAERGWGALAVADFAEPGALGRVLADGRGGLRAIVEARDASPDELALSTVNAGLYALPAPAIFRHLHELRPDNAQGELYLTDAVTAAARQGGRVELVALDDAYEATGVNDRLELARVHRLLVARAVERLALAGVTFLDPATTTIDDAVEIGGDSVVHAMTTLLGATRVGRGATIHAGAWIRDSAIGDGTTIEPYSVLDGATVGAGCRVGPFARLRPAAALQDGARVGNFVEVKNATLGPGAKANHLAYLGDATVGAGANVGAGVVTCNYDGVAKHRTEIGARAFVGSDTMLVAPVRIGDDATTGAGSVITQDVPDGALAVERTRQRHVEGWAARRGKKR